MEGNIHLNVGPQVINNDPYYGGVKFRGGDKAYYFSLPNDQFEVGDKVIIQTASGNEVAFLTTPVMKVEDYKGALDLKPILRKMTPNDEAVFAYNEKKEQEALRIVEREVEALGLAMNLVSAYLTLDGSKILISYTSTEKRVDFRELLRLIVPEIGCRVELRQLAYRDEAKLIGGIGICGLPLCCSRFLSNFEGISIQRAKNQMLTLNIPKLSGPCSKLICCLMYEDDAYTEAKREFPIKGTVIHTPDGDYSVDSFNVISKNVRLVNSTRDDYKTYPLEDILAMQKGTYVKKEAEAKTDELPSFGIHLTDASYGGMHPDKNDHGHYTEGAKPEKEEKGQDNNRSRNNRHNRGNNRDNRRDNRQDNRQNNNKNANANNQNNQNNQNGNRHNRNHNRHHRHGNNKNGGDKQ